MAAACFVVVAACSADPAPSGRATSSTGTTESSVAATTIPRATCAKPGEIVRIEIPSKTQSSAVRASVVASKNATEPTAVLYLLHGAGTDESQWEAIGIQAALDDLVATGQSRPFTIVLPDLPTGGDPALDGAAFLNDVVPAVEHCLGEALPASRRAVGGISRGGTLALEVVADHSDQFAAVGGHSPAVADVDQAALVQRLASSRVRVWLDVGTEDALRPATQKLATALSDAGSPPELQLSSGGHDRPYWAAHLDDYLRWYASVLNS